MLIFLHLARSRASTGDACWRSGVRRPRVRPRQPGSREASGHRPSPLWGAALGGLDGAGRTGRKPGDRAGEDPRSGPGSTVPKPKIAAVKRRKACRLRQGRRPTFRTGPTARRATRCGVPPAPLGASPPRLCRVGR